MTLVLDTGVLFAVLDRNDAHHALCRDLLDATREPLVVPSPVLVEVDYWIHQRLPLAALTLLLDDIDSGALEVADLHPGDYGRVRKITAQYADSPVGFVDASVMAVVERLGERKLATLDERHFRMIRPKHVSSLELLPGRP